MSSALATAKPHPLPEAAVFPEREERPNSWLERLAGKLSMPAALWFPGARLNEFGPILAITREDLAKPRRSNEVELRQRLPGVRTALRQSGFATPATMGKAIAAAALAAEHSFASEVTDRHVLAAAALLGGCAAELPAGEDRSLAAMLAAATAALAGIPVHLVTADDRLSDFHAKRMASIFRALDLDLGVVTRDLNVGARRAAYQGDVTIAAVWELMRDYLRDRRLLGKGYGSLRVKLERLTGKATRGERLVMRGLRFAIVLDTATVLIDQARAPQFLLEKTEAEVEQRHAEAAHRLVAPLEIETDFQVLAAEGRIQLTERGCRNLAELGLEMGGVWKSRPRREQTAEQALAARHLFQRDRDYLVENGRVQIMSESAARTMADTTRGEGLQQLIEVAEGCRATGRDLPVARMTVQRFLQRYRHLCGISADLRGTARELWDVYRLPVAKLERFPRYSPRRWTFATQKAKSLALAARVEGLRNSGHPVLIAVQSNVVAQDIGDALSAAGLAHETIPVSDGVAAAEALVGVLGQGRVAVVVDSAGRGMEVESITDAGPLSGLRVILGELLSSARLERRFASLHGQPHGVEAFLALDDPSMEALGTKSLERLARLPGAFGRACGRLAFALAQRRSERGHVRLRRELVKMDQRLGEILAFSGGTE